MNFLRAVHEPYLYHMKNGEDYGNFMNIPSSQNKKKSLNEQSSELSSKDFLLVGKPVADSSYGNDIFRCYCLITKLLA